MMNEQLLNNLIEKKAQLEKELTAINEMIKLEEAKAATTTAAPSIKDVKVETKIEEKQTSKGTEYIHTVIIDGKEFTRKSKKKYNFVTLVQGTGKVGIYGYASTAKTAESNARSWEKNSGKARVVAM